MITPRLAAVLPKVLDGCAKTVRDSAGQAVRNGEGAHACLSLIVAP